MLTVLDEQIDGQRKEQGSMMVASSWETTRRITLRVTPAQAHTWGLCGGFFQVQYRSGRAYEASYSSLLGTSVHELVAAFDRVTGNAQQDIDDLVRRHWHAGRFGPDDDQRAMAEAVQVLGSEVFYQTTPRALEAGYAIVLSGRIDRIAQHADGTIELLDLKTGAHLPTYDELYNDPATAIYHLLAAERHSTQRIVIAQRSLRTGCRVEVTLDTDGVAAGKDRLREMAHQLASEDYALTPSAACAFCPARATCPALLTTDAAMERPL